MKKEPISLIAWSIWFSAAFFYLYEFVLRASPGVITHELMSAFGVTSTSLGILTSVYYYAYTPLQIPCGLIVDRLGPRIVITISALLCVIGSYLFASSSTLFPAQVGRFLIGAGSACAFISCLKIGSEWFPPTRLALVAGITNMMGTLGGTFSGAPFAWLANGYGWRQALYLCSAIGLVVMLTSWLFIKDKNPKHFEGRQHSKQIPLQVALRQLLQNKQVWLIAGYACFSYLPISAFSELWAVPFLMKIYSIPNETAAQGNILLYIGTALGSLLAAWLSDFIESRKKVMMSFLLAAILLFYVIIFWNGLPLWLMFSLLFFVGIFSGAQVIGFACINEMYPTSMSGTASGLTNCIVMMGPIILQPLLGLVLDLVWDGRLTEAGIPMYTYQNYQASMVTILVCLFFGVILLTLSRETYGYRIETKH